MRSNWWYKIPLRSGTQSWDDARQRHYFTERRDSCNTQPSHGTEHKQITEFSLLRGAVVGRGEVEEDVEHILLRRIRRRTLLFELLGLGYDGEVSVVFLVAEVCGGPGRRTLNVPKALVD